MEVLRAGHSPWGGCFPVLPAAGAQPSDPSPPNPRTRKWNWPRAGFPGLQNTPPKAHQWPTATGSGFSQCFLFFLLSFIYFFFFLFAANKSNSGGTVRKCEPSNHRRPGFLWDGHFCYSTDQTEGLIYLNITASPHTQFKELKKTQSYYF